METVISGTISPEIPIQGELSYRIKLCLVSSYGSTSSGQLYDIKDHSAPVRLEAAQRVSLTPSAEISIGLFYTKAEFEDVVTNLVFQQPG